MKQLVKLKRLRDEVARTALDGRDRVLDCAVAGHDNTDDVRILLERRLDHLSPVDAGEAEVRDDDVEREISEQSKSILARLCLNDTVAVLRQPFGGHFTEG